MTAQTSLPVYERILQSVSERARKTKYAKEVIRPTAQPDEWTPKDMQIVVVGQNPTPVPEMGCPGNPPAAAWKMDVHLYLNVATSENDLTAIQTALSVFTADCIKALLSPSSSWHNWDNLAINSQISGMEQSMAGSFSSAKLVLTIFYRTDENNPYNPR